MGAGDPDITLAKIEIPVSKRDTARVVDAVLDLFSPLTETFGTIGDHVRLYRTRSVLQALAETKRLAEASGIKLKQPPLKFLIPYLEGVSKEDGEDRGLRSMWANLLLQASAEDSKAHPLLVEILDRMTSKDAIYLEKIIRNPRYRSKSINQIPDVAFEFDRFNRVDDVVDELIASIFEEDVVSELIRRVEDRGIILTSCGFYSIGPDGQERDIFTDHDEFPSADELNLHSLAALGLVRYPYNVVRKHKGGTFILTICVLTELGAEFFLTTHAPELRENASELPPYEDQAA
jgi:hypothetical protein